ncbi:Cytochrome oxidase biogenesis protein [Mycena indigotica]|uniref:Cytochrome oxidase biogenesis protein n=1 Tax=Mycena indigotica TaxID=2126181 RepID=A0A8H6SLD7_9AGAR|nr:Cytochrome oxidase biogenesis protein [Mycena indigotica]KAF7301753.1 Cytochrome oxidase biogenesis protein [Mycena indigotica]
MLRRGLSLGRVPRHVSPQRRFFIQSACDGFLDLATVIPFGSYIPPYSGTIILVTAVSRLALFPVALWGRNRVRTLEDVVLPEVERLKPILSKQVLDEMKKEPMPKEMLNVENLQRMHISRFIERVKAEQTRLVAQHKCYPRLAILASPLSQLPVFVFMTTLFNRLAADPTPFDSEAFFTLTTLNHPDATWTLPIMLGMITMANVESNNWLMSAVQRDRMRKMEEDREKQIAAGRRSPIQVHKIIKSSLSLLSVVRIIVAAFSPGSVVLYWTTSATLGLFQTWILDYRPSIKTSPAPPSPITETLPPKPIRKLPKSRKNK